MKKRIIALVLSVLLLFACLPFTTVAAGAATVVAENYTTTQGSYAYIYLRADNFVNVGVIDIELYYDSSVMSFNYVSNGTLFNSASVSTYTDTPGVVKISAMALNGLTSGTSTYSNRMMTICLKVNSNCPAGNYPIVVTVGDAYDGDFNPASITGTNGVVTVNQAAAKSFPVYATLSATSVEESDTFTLQAYHSSLSTYKFASADFHIEYDHELLKIKSIELDSKLIKEGAFYSINDSNPGIAIISYASTAAVSCSNFFKITFEVIANVGTSTDIKIAAKDVYDDNLVAFSPSSVTSTITINEKAAVVDYPDFMLEANKLIVGEASDIYVVLEGNSQVAAGDFVINYDKDVLQINSVTAEENALANGALIVINPSFSEGEVRFSYINQKGNFVDDTKIVKITATPVVSPDNHYVITSSGIDVCDIKFNDVTLDYVSNSNCIFVPKVTAPTCEAEGYTTYTCSCGESYVDNYVSAIDHTFGEWITDKAATETEKGSKHRECACGEKETKAIPQTLKFATAALTLQSNIEINFKVNAAMFSTYGYTEPYAVFTFYDEDGNAEETTVTEYRIEDGTGRYLFDFKNIAPNRINDTVEGVLYAKYEGEWYESATVTYSAATYCYRQLNNATVASDNIYAEFRTMIVDLLNYATAAQIHTGYRVNELANANLTATQASWGTTDSRELKNDQDAFYKTIENQAAAWKSAGLNLKEAVVIRLKLETTNPEGLSVKIVGKYNEWEITADKFDPVIGEANRYYVYFDSLDASQMSEKVYATIYKDGVPVSNTLQYTIETYAAKNAVAGTTLGDLLIAMMRYGDAAYKYVN